MRKSVSAVALAAALSACAVPAAASVRCFAELSAGKSVTSTAFDTPAGEIALAADGLQAGIGAGCDMGLDRVVIGALLRYDLTDVDTTLLTASGDAVWTAALRMGVMINPGTLVYGLAGISGTELRFGGIDYDPQGLVLGGGIEFDAFLENLSVFLEYTRTTWDDRVESGVTIKPDSDVVRAGLKIKFGVLK